MGSDQHKVYVKREATRCWAYHGFAKIARDRIQRVIEAAGTGGKSILWNCMVRKECKVCKAFTKTTSWGGRNSGALSIEKHRPHGHCKHTQASKSLAAIPRTADKYCSSTSILLKVLLLFSPLVFAFFDAGFLNICAVYHGLITIKRIISLWQKWQAPARGVSCCKIDAVYVKPIDWWGVSGLTANVPWIWF